MIDFVFILKLRILRRDEFGRPSKQRHNHRANSEETTPRDDKAGDNTERDGQRVHTPRLDGATDG